MKSRNLWIIIGVVVVLLAVAAAWLATAPRPEQATPQQPPQQPPTPQPTPQGVVKIGFLGPVATTYGDIALKTIRLAVDEINSRGGLLGRRVEIVVFDDENKPDVAATGFRKLTQEDKVVAIFGIHSSAVGLALLPLIKEAKVPVFAMGAVSDAIDSQVASDPGLKFWFRFNVNASMHALMVTEPAKYFAQKLGYKRVGILYDQHAWTEPVVKRAKAEIQRAGLELVYEGIIEPGKTTSFIPHLTKARDSGVQILLVWSAYGDGKVLQRDYNELKPPFLLVQFDVVGMGIGQWNVTGGALAYQIFSFYSFPATDAGKRFEAEYGRRYGPLTYFYPPFFIYDAVNAWASAVQAVGSFDGDKVASYLEEKGYRGTSGYWRFTKGHAPLFGVDYITTVAVQWWPDGKAHVVWPPGPGAEEFRLPPWIKG
jgi:branched-chain amino acid transport system substrate-binding protein